MDNLIGKILDKKYKIIKKLGSGGFGTVYLADDSVAQRKVAIKVLNNIDEETEEDILNEIRNIAKINHNSVVTFYHHFRENDKLYMVMEYCINGSLRDLLYDESKINIAKAFEIVFKICEIFEFIHEKGIIHHDIKPDNILFSSKYEIKIGDFGVANKNIGTAAYMPPEMFLNEIVSSKDVRTDVYSLGFTLLEIILGENPLFGLNHDARLSKKLSPTLIPNTLPHWVQDILLKALNPVPERRFQTMTEFKEAIESKNVPHIQNYKLINAHLYAKKGEKLLKLKKWRAANKYINYALNLTPDCIPALLLQGKYFLSIRKIKDAQQIFEKIKILNPRVNIQKELGWIYLELGNYSYAISLLNDYLYRNASDFEAHNLLFKCFYETNRFDVASNMGNDLLPYADSVDCFLNNIFICDVLSDFGNVHIYSDYYGYSKNPFINYNQEVIKDYHISWESEKRNTFKNKLIFQEYRFNSYEKNNVENIINIDYEGKTHSFSDTIISIGRNSENSLVLKSNSISRRHCVLINLKNEVWLYDLNSTLNTYVDGKKVKNRIFLNGVREVKLASEKLIVHCKENILI